MFLGGCLTCILDGMRFWQFAHFLFLGIEWMASPQKEDGYVPVATEIYEALCKIRIPGEARQVLDFIIRKTYGFHKKEDMIALSQFVLGTGLKKTNICRSLNKLSQMNLIVIKKDNGNTTKYRLNKDYDMWKPLSKKITLSKKIMPVIKKDNEPLSNRRHTIDTITIDNYTKDILPEYSLVKLSKKEYDKLVALMGEELVKDFIERVYLYCKSKGKTYRDYYATILNWYKKEKRTSTSQSPSPLNPDGSYVKKVTHRENSSSE